MVLISFTSLHNITGALKKQYGWWDFWFQVHAFGLESSMDHLKYKGFIQFGMCDIKFPCMMALDGAIDGLQS
jgi:hypothetical protein